MPKKREEAVEAEVVNKEKKSVRVERNDGRLMLGLVFVFIGLLIFLNNFFPNFEVAKYFWPVVLIVFGVTLVSRSF